MSWGEFITQWPGLRKTKQLLTSSFSTRTFLGNSVSEYEGHENKHNRRVQLALLINCKIFPES